jgi:hypothetical protein
MRLGFFEIVLILAVLLSVLVIWRWMRQGNPGDTDDEDSPPSFLQRLGTIGILLVLGGLGLVFASYIILLGIAKMFIWAVAIVLLGMAFLLLSRR